MNRLFNYFLACTFLLIHSTDGYGQVALPSYPDSSFPTYYWQKATQLELLPKTKGATIFIGDSLTDGAEWSALFRNPAFMNFGISSDGTAGLLQRLPEVVKRQPKKLFLMIGINDLAKGMSVDSVYRNISLALKYINQHSSATQVYVQSLLPVNDQFKSFRSHTAKGNAVLELNALLAKGAKDVKYSYLNLHSSFSDEKGQLKSDFTNDGLHLKGAGYALWAHLIYPQLYDLQETASLIPQPKQLLKAKGLFPLYEVKHIFYQTDSLRNEAVALQKILADAQVEVSLTKDKNMVKAPFIALEVNNAAYVTEEKESYQLQVSTEKVVIKAFSKAGVFYGIQTLKQLGRDGYFINAVEIRDVPAFSWRAYMVDVGRNYQSVALLKEQIAIMAAYKLNVFHLHLTEDIAWRLAIKQYPQLTSPEFMERNKGMYYTEAELKDLIAFCKERHILLVPEIDMPGHSAAFKKAMKVDMQSDSGVVIVKNILKEIVGTYDFPYLHIGADEVKITNNKFLPEIGAYLKSMNRKVIGWEPGGNFDPSTIRQLWMEDVKVTNDTVKIQYIDSRHLYINHMDPLESVVTIFNRKLANVDAGNSQVLGATLCLWPDRAVATEEDAIRMNGVYPAVLAFAERSWIGKGHTDWIANMTLTGKVGLDDFVAFERGLMDHKKQYFSGLSFPYQRQADLHWNLYGPYDNQGNLGKKFAPEMSASRLEKMKVSQVTTGGTIVLRHWWAPKIKGVVKDPKENTTWYAVQKMWSDQDTVLNFWIGFNDFSRSQAVDSPPAGQWDTHHSAVWVNEELIPAPSWLHAGQPGNLEIPLADEGYTYRVPTALKLKKGWNTVRIKAPIGSFSGKNWNNPEKWMFTFVEVKN